MDSHPNKQGSRTANKTRWRYLGEIILPISTNRKRYNKALNKTIVLNCWVTETLNVVVACSFLHETLHCQPYDKQAQVTMLLRDPEEDALRVRNGDDHVLHPVNQTHGTRNAFNLLSKKNSSPTMSQEQYISCDEVKRKLSTTRYIDRKQLWRITPATVICSSSQRWTAAYTDTELPRE